MFKLAHGSLVTPLIAFMRVSAGVSDFRSGTIWAKSPNDALMNHTSPPRPPSSAKAFQNRLSVVSSTLSSRLLVDNDQSQMRVGLCRSQQRLCKMIVIEAEANGE